MKKTFFFLCLFLFLACKNGVVESTEEVSFFGCASSPVLDVMVGSEGALFKSSHTSLAWEKVNIEETNTLLSVVYNRRLQTKECQTEQNSREESAVPTKAPSQWEKFYAVGHNGTVLISEDGIAWESRCAAKDSHLFAVAVHTKGQKNRIVTVGHKKVMYVSDDDGLSWQKKHGVANKRTSLYDVAYGAGIWLAVGDYGAAVILYDDTDTVSESVVQLGGHQTLKGIAFADTLKRWVAVGHEGVIFVSDDAGLSWQEADSNTKEDLLKVAFNGKRFLAVGTHGMILVSKDGKNWKQVQINNNGTFRAVSWIGERWLLVTIEGKKEVMEDVRME